MGALGSALVGAPARHAQQLCSRRTPGAHRPPWPSRAAATSIGLVAAAAAPLDGRQRGSEPATLLRPAGATEARRGARAGDRLSG